MRTLVVLGAVVGLGVAGVFLLGTPPPPGRVPAGEAAPDVVAGSDTTGDDALGDSRPAVPRCTWQMGQDLAFEVHTSAELTFDEGALLETSGVRKAGSAAVDTRRRQSVSSTGRLDVRVVSVTSGGEAILAARLSNWQSDLDAAEAFPGIERDMSLPYLMRVDGRCDILATARLETASVIAYRRVLAVLDRIDFALPPPGTGAGLPYTLRQLDDFGWYTSRNVFRAGDGRGSVERSRIAYEAVGNATDALPLEMRIRSAGGTVRLGNSLWFEAIMDSEDIDAVSRGRVPFSSKATFRITETGSDPQAFHDVAIVVADYVWGRPTEAELNRAHESARAGDLAGVSTDEAMNRFFDLREGGKPGAWHDSQRLLRDWMLANPEGVRELGRMLADGRFGVGDQADLVLALAKSGSPEAREELESLVLGGTGDQDLRVQAASALGDVVEPTTRTVSVLDQVGGGRRSSTPDDILASTATMSIGTIVYNVPTSPAAAAARKVLHKRLASGDSALKIEALFAASNSGDAAFFPAAQEASKSEVAEERAAGAHTLRKMIPSESTEEVLNTLLRDDEHPEVVKEVVESRRAQLQTYGGELNGGELSLYATKLPSAPEGVRWEMIRTIGEAGRMQPEAKEVLVDWFRHEPVMSLRVLIGQYVSADELAARP